MSSYAEPTYCLMSQGTRDDIDRRKAAKGSAGSAEQKSFAKVVYAELQSIWTAPRAGMNGASYGVKVNGRSPQREESDNQRRRYVVVTSALLQTCRFGTGYQAPQYTSLKSRQVCVTEPER